MLSGTGISLASDDNSGQNSDALVKFAPTLSGYYYASASGSGNSFKGTYEIVVTTTPDDFAGDTTTTAQLSTGQPQKGLIETANDADWFQAVLMPGNYIISASADTKATWTQ